MRNWIAWNRTLWSFDHIYQHSVGSQLLLLEEDSATRVQILNMAVYILHNARTIRKAMNRTILPHNSLEMTVLLRAEYAETNIIKNTDFALINHRKRQVYFNTLSGRHSHFHRFQEEFIPQQNGCWTQK